MFTSSNNTLLPNRSDKFCTDIIKLAISNSCSGGKGRQIKSAASLLDNKLSRLEKEGEFLPTGSSAIYHYGLRMLYSERASGRSPEALRILIANAFSLP